MDLVNRLRDKRKIKNNGKFFFLLSNGKWPQLLQFVAEHPRCSSRCDTHNKINLTECLPHDPEETTRTPDDTAFADPTCRSEASKKTEWYQRSHSGYQN